MASFRSVLVTVAQVLLFLLFGKHAGEFGGRALDRWALAQGGEGPPRPRPLPSGHHRRAS